jgi:DNA-binding FadR family transcriptional regulator
LPLGAALSRRKLAAELGMSLLLVAEALQRLESDGLVESRPRIGTQVCLPSTQDVRERYEIREALESQAARLFAEKASVRERLEMERMAEQMDAMFNRCASGDNDGDQTKGSSAAQGQSHCRDLRRSFSSLSTGITWSFTCELPSAPAAERFAKPSKRTTF